MALFATAPAGSGVLTPIFPDLKFRWSTDGLGEVYEDLVDGFLVVWNADMVDRAIEYSPGLFTPVIVRHTGHVVSWGANLPDLKPWPLGLAADFERNRYPVSIISWPVNYNRWQYDTAYNTHTTGDSRRSLTWGPMRAMLHSTDPLLKENAFFNMRSWCIDQLCRPLSSCAGPFTPPQDVDTCGNSWEWNEGTSRAWGYDSQVVRPDQTGTNRSWNSFDPAHNESGPQFAYAAAGGRLGVVLIWMLFRWVVQGASPISRCFNSSYSVPFDQERSIKWCLDLCTRAFMLGLEWADPDLVRDWCGGLDGKNGGLGFRPRESLRAYFDRVAGPEYGGTGGPSARRMWQKANNFSLDSHYQPYLGSTRSVCGGQGQCNSNFQFNGKSYGRLFDAEKGFHRYLLMQALPEVIRAHDFLQTLDPSDPLLDPARVPQLRTFVNDFACFVAETGMHGAWSTTSRGRFRQYPHVFVLNAAEKGFESFAAIDQAIRDAIACNPLDCDGSGNAWVYPGTNPLQRWHLFAVQHDRWAPGAGLWFLHVGVFNETEAKETGPGGYASAFGYDADLQAIIDANAIPKGGSSYYSNRTTADHYDIVWRAVELQDTYLEPLIGGSARLDAGAVAAVNEGGGSSTTDLSAAFSRVAANATTRVSFGTSTHPLDGASAQLGAGAVAANNAPALGTTATTLQQAVARAIAGFVARPSDGEAFAALDGGAGVLAALAVAANNVPSGGGGSQTTTLSGAVSSLAALTVGRDGSGSSTAPLATARARLFAAAVDIIRVTKDPPRRRWQPVLPELFLEVGGSVDLVLEGGDLQPDVGVRSMILTALFTDARAPADVLERLGERDPRGVWSEEPGTREGSLLWTHERAKLTPQEISRVREDVEAALAFVVQEGIAQRVVVEARRGDGDRLDVVVVLERGNATGMRKAWLATEAAELELGRVRLHLLTR